MPQWLSAKGQVMVRRPHPEVGFPGSAGEVLHHQVLRLQAVPDALWTHAPLSKAVVFQWIIILLHKKGKYFSAPALQHPHAVHVAGCARDAFAYA